MVRFARWVLAQLPPGAEEPEVKLLFEQAAAVFLFPTAQEAARLEAQVVTQGEQRSVVPPGDNFYAALNSAVFSDGSFVYIPEGVRCPMELSSYFRINARNTGQFERTLIIADAVSYTHLTLPTSDLV